VNSVTQTQNGTAGANRRLVDWLNTFSKAVRDRDCQGARPLFSPQAVGFGTRAARYDGLDDLIDQQWRPIWTSTSGFEFDLSSLKWGQEGHLIWVAIQWSSWGQERTGRRFRRNGRATLVLHDRGNQLQAQHSHFSLDPHSVAVES
jgi:ketosteroid isomerase-like protein